MSTSWQDSRPLYKAAATDARPERRLTWQQQRDAVDRKIRNLVDALEGGTTGTAVLQALRARENELAKVDAAIGALDAPTDGSRLAVIPNWVKQQVSDVVALLQDRPERVKTEISRLGIRFRLYPVHEEGQKPYLRAVGEGNFEAIVGSGSPFPAGLSLQGAAG